jgi:hypothetical protein
MRIINQKTTEEFDWGFWNYAWDLEKEWQVSLPKFTDKELLEIFPEAKPYLRYKLKKYKKQFKKLAFEIKKDLERIYKRETDEFTTWFLEKIIEIWKGEKLNWIDREIKRMKWLLYPKKLKGKITKEQIQKAKEYPLEKLIEAKRNFALCPFHSEKNPSFYIKNNWGYCFACGWHGDSIKFVMDKCNLSFLEAVKYLTE